MDALENLKTRRSVRNYQTGVIDKKIIEELVDCARLAPTANNLQPWEFIAITNKATLAEISAITDHGKFIKEAAGCIVVFCKDTKYYLEDGSAATQNIMLSAHAKGLGSCWVAGDKKPYAETMRKFLNVPEGFKLVSIIALGYPANIPQPKKRALTEVLHWEKY